MESTLRTNHHGEDDGSLGGLDDPQQDQTAQLDDSEEVDLPQGDVTEIDEVGLVLRRHAEQREAVKELGKIELCILFLDQFAGSVSHSLCLQPRKHFLSSRQKYVGNDVQLSAQKNVSLSCRMCDYN